MYNLSVAVAVKEFVSNIHHHDDVYIAGELHGNKRMPITLMRVSNRDKDGTSGDRVGQEAFEK